MKNAEIDPKKICSQARKLRKDRFIELFDRAVSLIPKRQLKVLVEGYLDPVGLLADGTSSLHHLEAVRRFNEESLRGKYYEDFEVNSKNFMQRSRGTEAWIAECERLFEQTAVLANGSDDVAVLESFDVLIGLLDHIDEAHDDVIFFADEGGSYEVGVDWKRILPLYFKHLAHNAEADDFARTVKRVIESHVSYDRDKFLIAANAAANPAQRKALGALRVRKK